MSDNPISLKQAAYRSGLAISLFRFISEKTKNECTTDLNNLIALASGINQEVHHALLKYSPTPLTLRLLSYIKHRRPVPLTQAMHLTRLGISLYEVILDQASKDCSTESHDMLSLACDINQEVYRALLAVIYDE
ncbi:hypothetical protein [Xenorhabdus sp. Sc-CR9]|uniref:hypothetical protein n=1 Tax=Xenorhabdus sp. Sc-CR9 TaxID=2584468 RepID=UPI001F260FA4